MADPFDNNAVSIYGQYAQFELLASGSTAPAASGSAVRVFASASKLWMVRPGEDHKEIATTSDGLDFNLQDGDGIADFTFDGSGNATVAVDIDGLTGASGVEDADTVMVYDSSAGALRKMTRAAFIESAALDSIDIDGGAIDGATLGANAQVTITDADMNGGTIDNVVIGGATPAAGTFTTLSAGGNVTLGDAASDTVTVNADVASDLIPSADSTYDLGSSTDQWAELHVDAAHIDQLGSALDANSQAITNVNIDSGAIDGVTIGTNSPATQVVATQLTASAMKVENDLLVVGDLQVQGNIDSVSVTQNSLEVSDYLIIAGNSGSAANMDGGGLQFGGTKLGGGEAAAILYDDSNSSLDFNIGSATEVRLEDGVLRPERDDDVDLGASGAEFKDLYLDGVAYVDELRADLLGAALDANSQAITNINVDSGAIDGTVIGANSAAAGTFTTLAATSLSASAAVSGFSLDLEQNADIDGTLDVAGAVSLAASGVETDVRGTLSVDEAAVFDSSLRVDGAFTANGNVDLGDAASDTITANGQFDSDLVPSADSSYDLGSSTKQWAELHVDAAHIDQLGAALDANSQNITGVGTFSAGASTVTSLSVSDGDITNVGDIALDSISADGTELDFNLTDNVLQALEIKEGSNVYMSFSTSNGQEGIAVGKNFGPASDDAIDLGNSTYQWRDLYLDGVAYLDEVSFDGVATITNSSNAMQLSASAGISIVGDPNASGYLLELPNDADARARAWVTYSSARYKTNVKSLENPIETVKSLRGVSYDWKGTGQNDVGFIAEEVGAIVPEVVSFGADGRAEGIDYGRLTSVLVEAMKAQQTEIEKLQTVVQNLTSEQPHLLEN
jgi:hypothetical protein